MYFNPCCVTRVFSWDLFLNLFPKSAHKKVWYSKLFTSPYFHISIFLWSKNFTQPLQQDIFVNLGQFPRKLPWFGQSVTLLNKFSQSSVTLLNKIQNDRCFLKVVSSDHLLFCQSLAWTSILEESMTNSSKSNMHFVKQFLTMLRAFHLPS